MFTEYGPYWCNIRKLCTVHLLTTSKVETFAPLRREELRLAVKSLEKVAAAREVVDLGEVVENFTKNIVYKMVLDSAKDDKSNLKRLVQEGMHFSWRSRWDRTFSRFFFLWSSPKGAPSLLCILVFFF